MVQILNWTWKLEAQPFEILDKWTPFCQKNIWDTDKNVQILNSWDYSHMLAGWFTQKNLRRHSDIYNVYYYWHDSGSFNYSPDNYIGWSYNT